MIAPVLRLGAVRRRAARAARRRHGAVCRQPRAISAYVRADGQQRLLVVHNLVGTPAMVKLLSGPFGQVIRTTRDGVNLDGQVLTLPVHATAILQ